MHRTLMLRAAAIAAALSFTTTAGAQLQEQDMAEITAYRLTEDALTRYSDALRSLAALPQDELRSFQAAVDAEPETASLDQAVALYERHPAVAAAITATGMPIREFFLFTVGLTQAGTLGAAPAEALAALPPAMRDNAAFFHAHEADLRRLAAELAELTRRGRASP